MKLVEKTTINAPVSQVWDGMAQQFDRAADWMSIIPTSVEKTSSIGGYCLSFSRNQELLCVDLFPRDGRAAAGVAKHRRGRTATQHTFNKPAAPAARQIPA